MTITITTLGLLAILSCWFVIHLSCKKDCSTPCDLTASEKSFFSCYNNPENILFKNDVTSVTDTLVVNGMGLQTSTCSSECGTDYTSYGAIIGWPTFHPIGSIEMGVWHGNPPSIGIEGKHWYGCDLIGPTQTFIVNGTTYNDVYSVQIDSTRIDTCAIDKPKIPWKMYYSKSKGFVRFYMVNGQTWSKL